MTAKLIDGTALSKTIRSDVAARAAALTARGQQPGLAVVLVGENPASEVYVLHSRQGDPLAIRALAGTITPTKGGTTKLVFASDFTMPTLSPPE